MTLQRGIKRGVDLVLGTILALAALPVVALLAIPTAVVLRANPFFVQDRVGKDGRLFRLLKLRTLPPQAPAYADKYAIEEVSTPPWCELMRRLHLDELPQLFLVPLGRMSLVGPRPEMAFLHDQMDPHLAERRVSTRPGCTGLWQISEACAGLILETPEFDLFYLHHHNFRLDLWIVWRTLFKVLNVGRAVRLEDIPSWVCTECPEYRASLELVYSITDDVVEAASA